MKIQIIINYDTEARVMQIEQGEDSECRLDEGDCESIIHLALLAMHEIPNTAHGLMQ